jgi:hypothetical protein
LYEISIFTIHVCLGKFSIDCPLLTMIEQLLPNNMVYLIREILGLIMQHISEIITVTLSQ